MLPLSLMTKLTYTATQGSYFNESETNMSVTGWERPEKFTEDPPAGMRALLFLQTDTLRGVIAFRGTDLGAGESGQADRCADALLIGDEPPPYCGKFPASTLDYWHAALAFIGRVRAAYPLVDLLLTGHSLGAGLALATAVASAEDGSLRPAVAFAAPAWVRILEQQAHVPAPLAMAARQRLYAMADEWDPVQKEAEEEHGLAGTECKWSSTATAACTLCFGAQPFNASALGCSECFRERHVYAHYLNVDVPGERAVCSDI